MSDGRRGQPRGAASGRAPASRPHFTGRAAVLAIVLCGIALSLAYPVREYISQRRQIDQLLAQGNQIRHREQRLEAERRLLHSPVYIEQQARDRLHMCLPTQMCYEIIGPSGKPRRLAARVAATPWYARLWSSVQQANASPGGGRGAGRPPQAGRHRTAGRR
jgi:cell division protein FtsB